MTRKADIIAIVFGIVAVVIGCVAGWYLAVNPQPAKTRVHFAGRFDNVGVEVNVK